MAKKILCLIGGVIMIISVFLPTLFSTATASGWGITASATVYYWMFGFAYLVFTISGGGASASFTDSAFFVDYLGITCMIIIIVGAILAFVMANSDSNGAMIGGLLGLLGMIIYLIGVYGGFAVLILKFLSPFIGAYLCIIGGIIALVGGLLES